MGFENLLEDSFVLNRYEDGSTEKDPSFLIISRSDFILLVLFLICHLLQTVKFILQS